MDVNEVLVLAAAFVPIGLLIVLSVENSQRELIAVLAVSIGTILCALAAACRELAAERRDLTRNEKVGLGTTVGVATIAVGVGGAFFRDVSAGLALALGIEVVYLSAFWRHWLFFAPRGAVEPRWKSWTMLALGATAITLAFSALCAVLLRQEHVEARAPVSAGSSTPAATYDAAATGAPAPFSVAFENAAWTVADAVPVLDIPRTLDDWKPRYALAGRVGGWLLLGYKLLVLLPLVGLLGGFVEQVQKTASEPNEASSPA